MKLEGKTAIVTGGGSGIGRGISLRYAREGASVVVADLDTAGAENVAEEINSADGKALAVTVDVTDREGVKNMVAAAVKEFGGLDILVNNAGVGKIIPFMETTEADFDLFFNVNCKGLMICSQEAAKQMIAQNRGGKIVNLASQAGRRGESLVMAYCASKAAVISMNQSIALALAEHKINVNAIAPGAIPGGGFATSDDAFQPKRKIPLGRFGAPEDISGPALALLSNRFSQYVTGVTLPVDGGLDLYSWIDPPDTNA